MSRYQPWQSSTALLTALTLVAGAATPIIIQAPARAQLTFSDISPDYWARAFIQELDQRDVVSGFPDGTFRPNDPVTRAQFAAMVRQAFPRSPMRQAVNFVDVPSDYWAAAAIQDAYTTGFLAGYPDNVFRPEENISRAQVLVSLANGLGYSTSGATDNTLQVYADASAIPDWAKGSIAAATEKRIVVNYPNLDQLNPNRVATRAEVAAFIHQALVSAGQVAAIPSPYIVGQAATTPQPSAVQIPAGTTIPVRYDEADRILISPNEPEPVPVVLTVNRDIISQGGRVLIPANSQVSGELRVVDGGAQFYATELILPNRTSRPISATSSVITTTENVTKGANVLEILAGTALGAGAAAAITGLTGDRVVEPETVLGGGAAGALAGLLIGRNSVSLIVIDPATDLDLTLDSALVFR